MFYGQIILKVGAFCEQNETSGYSFLSSYPAASLWGHRLRRRHLFLTVIPKRYSLQLFPTVIPVFSKAMANLQSQRNPSELLRQI